MNDTTPTREEYNKLKQDLDDLINEVYKNNFSASQDFNKKSSFTTVLKVPSYAVLPATCDMGEIIEVTGKLRICSAVNTWTIVGLQN